MSLKKILFYDLHSSGHHFEYINYLVSFCPDRDRVKFAIQKNLCERFDKMNSQFIELPFEENETNREKELQWIIDTKVNLEIEHIFFCNIDPYLGSLLNFKSHIGKFSGIYFHSHHRISVSAVLGYKSKIKYELKKLRGKYLSRIFNTWEHKPELYILDDKEGVKKLNDKYDFFRYLPDPIPKQKIEIDVNLADSKTMKKVLIFGSIIPRKNLELLINAIDVEVLKTYQFQIVGRGNENYVNQLQRLCVGKENNISIENEFISNDKMEKLFAECDVVMMVYKNFFGSSGVLGRAAKYGKRVVVSQGGLIEHLVEKYKLGVAIKNNYKHLATALKRMEKWKNEPRYNDYLKDKTPESFAGTIYNSLNE